MEQCEARDPSGRQCLLPANHSEPHRSFPDESTSRAALRDPSATAMNDTRVAQFPVAKEAQIGGIVSQASATAAQRGLTLANYSYVPNSGYTKAAQLCFLIGAGFIFVGFLAPILWIGTLAFGLAGLTSKKSGGTVIVTFGEPSPPAMAQASAIPTGAATGQLHELKNLLEAGLLTRDEYDRKRAEVIAKL